MEIKSLDDLKPTGAPVWFDLIHPNGQTVEFEGQPCKLLINGPDSEVMIAFERRAQKKMLAVVGRTGRPDLDAEDIERQSILKAATAITGWENFPINGMEAYTPELAKDLVSQYRWIRDFVEDVLRNSRGNFLGGKAPAVKKP